MTKQEVLDWVVQWVAPPTINLISPYHSDGPQRFIPGAGKSPLHLFKLCQLLETFNLDDLTPEVLTALSQSINPSNMRSRISHGEAIQLLRGFGREVWEKIRS